MIERLARVRVVEVDYKSDFRYDNPQARHLTIVFRNPLKPKTRLPRSAR